MVCVPGTFLGLLLGVSAFLLVLSVLTYRRSGVRTILLLSEGLAVHVAFTVVILASACLTDWFEDVDNWILVAVDAIVFVVVIVLAYLGGRSGARRS